MDIRRTGSVRANIQSQAASFGLYVDGILEQNEVKGLIDGISKQVQTYVFSGIIRNFLLGYLNNRDIDFVVINSPSLKIPISQLRDITIQKNKFDGYKLLTEHLAIDVWDMERTWGILQEGMRKTAYSLMGTAFFNFSSIVYDYNKKRFYITDEFCKFFSTHVMEVVYEKNPRIASCIVNSLYYADKYDFVIGESLRKWIVKHYSKDLDYKAAQESRFNKIVYSDALIRAFNNICSKSEIYKHGVVNLYDDTNIIVLRFDQ